MTAHRWTKAWRVHVRRPVSLRRRIAVIWQAWLKRQAPDRLSSFKLGSGSARRALSSRIAFRRTRGDRSFPSSCAIDSRQESEDRGRLQTAYSRSLPSLLGPSSAAASNTTSAPDPIAGVGRGTAAGPPAAETERLTFGGEAAAAFACCCGGDERADVAGTATGMGAGCLEDWRRWSRACRASALCEGR
jgi:hypothetical protein